LIDRAIDTSHVLVRKFHHGIGIALVCLGTCTASNPSNEKFENAKALVSEQFVAPEQTWNLPASTHDAAVIFRSPCAYVDASETHRANAGDARFIPTDQAIQWRSVSSETCDLVLITIKSTGPAADGPIPPPPSQRNDHACKPNQEGIGAIQTGESNTDEVLIDNQEITVTRETLYPGVPRPPTRRREDQVTVFLDPAIYVLAPKDDAERVRSPDGYICRRAGVEVQWFPKGQEVSMLTNLGPMLYRIDVVRIK